MVELDISAILVKLITSVCACLTLEEANYLTLPWLHSYCMKFIILLLK